MSTPPVLPALDDARPSTSAEREGFVLTEGKLALLAVEYSYPRCTMCGAEMEVLQSKASRPGNVVWSCPNGERNHELGEQFVEYPAERGNDDVLALLDTIATLTSELTSLRASQEEGARDKRQFVMAQWGIETFGASTFTPERRALRFLEEALEMAQACGVPRENISRLIEYVYSRPVGEPAQELGGCGVTLLALAHVLQLSADDAERVEVARVLAIPAEQFRKRHDAKAAAGVAEYSDPAASLPSVEVGND